jgi:lysophospholipase L1-like esterase
MNTVLCYGDSLTWGMNAATMMRHAYEDLWPSVVEKQLSGAVRVINASLGGRSTSFDDHSVPADRNGARILPTILGTFDPIDVVVIMLGTNDMKTWINGSAVAAAQGMRRLVEIVRGYPYEGGAAAPRILIVSPPPATELAPFGAFPLLSPRTAEGLELPAKYKVVAETTGCEFFDAATVASTRDGGDGVHLDARNTRAIGEALVPIIARMLDISTEKAA